jgi:hypothetical protein
MSKSICKAYKKNRNDELYTPRILVECLKSYFEEWVYRNNYTGHYFIPKGHGPKESKRGLSSFTVWCPFDKETSEYVLFFKELGCKVIYSHIDYEQNFLGIKSENLNECVEPYVPSEHFDIIVSNPPFSRKLDVFKRCNELGKPWVMLSNIMCLNYMEIGNYFADNPIQLLIPDKRVSFDGNPSSFCSGYFCKNFLQKDLEFCHLPHCNSGNDYVPSRMYQNAENII